MKTYSVSVIEKTWFTVDVLARTAEEAKRVIRAAVVHDEPPLTDAETHLHEANQLLLDDFWVEASETGYTEVELGIAEVLTE